MKQVRPLFILALLLAASFSIGTVLQPRATGWSGRGNESMLKVMLGDGRRLFANHFFVMADVYFHSGYYPSIFDRGAAPKDSRHMMQSEEDEHSHELEHPESGPVSSNETAAHVAEEKEQDFLGKPRDIFEAFGRHFMVTRHTHLENGKEREILPWLKLSAELDPQRVDTYTVSAFWLRKLGKVTEARDFLREGWKANPNSYEILFELGRLYYENEHDTARARNLWELALKRWMERENAKPQPDLLALDEIAVNLAHLEQEAGDKQRAIEHYSLALRASPNPAEIKEQIHALQAEK